MVAHTWTDGAEVDLSDDEWAVLRAGFLGCGFRVVVPAGPERPAALQRSRALALEVAARVGATLDETPWQFLGEQILAGAPAPHDRALEVTGGWTHRFRAPAGACHTRVAPWHHDGPGRVGVTLPWQRNEHSPLTGLPALSGHEEARAEQWLQGRVGVWTSTAGHLVDTTAGPPLLLTDDGWAHPAPEDGTVPHHLWERARAELAARPWRGPVPQELTAVVCVAPDGHLTRLASLDGRPLPGLVDEALARLRQTWT